MRETAKESTQFEQWALINGYDVKRHGTIETQYENSETQRAWWAWKAGRWASADDLNRLTKPSEGHDERYLAGYETAIEQVRRMLRRDV